MSERLSRTLIAFLIVVALTFVAMAALAQTTSVTLSGTAMDTVDGDISSSIIWSSDLDGDLGTGKTVVFDGLVRSLGSHVITATITDSLGAVASDSITITVTQNDPPTITIDEPADGTIITINP